MLSFQGPDSQHRSYRSYGQVPPEGLTDDPPNGAGAEPRPLGTDRPLPGRPELRPSSVLSSVRGRGDCLMDPAVRVRRSGDAVPPGPERNDCMPGVTWRAWVVWLVPSSGCGCDDGAPRLPPSWAPRLVTAGRAISIGHPDRKCYR